MLLLSRLTHYAAIKDNKSVNKKSNKRKNRNLHSCENLTFEPFFIAREHLENSICLFLHLCITIIPCGIGFTANFLAFSTTVFESRYNVTFSRSESCLRSFASLRYNKKKTTKKRLNFKVQVYWWFSRLANKLNYHASEKIKSLTIQ